jgi:hypothetical protein
VAGAGLLGYMLFSAWLYGSASPAASYAGPIPLAVERSFALLRVGRGLLGWLFDTQRGLLITAPIYIAALWGAGLLLVRKPLSGCCRWPFGARRAVAWAASGRGGNTRRAFHRGAAAAGAGWPTVGGGGRWSCR